MSEAKEIPLHAMLSAASGRLMGDFSEMHEAMEYLMGRPVWTHEMGIIGREIGEAIKAEFPDLVPVCQQAVEFCEGMDRSGGRDGIQAQLSAWVAGCGLPDPYPAHPLPTALGYASLSGYLAAKEETE